MPGYKFRNGFLEFHRLENGDVEVHVGEPTKSMPRMILLIAAEEWAKVLASVCGDQKTFDANVEAARSFHEGGWRRV